MQNYKTIVIVGAGVSGLTAGIYAEQHGFHAILLEKNPSVGGMCTGWYRDGFYIDGCVHWLTGTKEGTMLNEMWHNLDAIKDQKDILYLDSWGTFEYGGEKVTLWCDLDRAEKEWKELSPIDSKRIHKFFNMVRDFKKVELPVDLPVSLIPLNRKLKLGFQILPIWPSFLATMRIKRIDFANKFKSPVLRFALNHAQSGDGNLFSMIYSYASISNRDGGIPMGASKPMVERMKEKFLSLGGTLKLNANVEQIIIDNKTAKGVKLKNGEIIEGDYVVTCLDTNYVLKKLLRDQYPFPAFEKRISDVKRYPSPGCVLINYSVCFDNNLPIPYSFTCKPFKVANKEISHITVRSYSYDPTFTRGDKTVLSVLINQSGDDYAFWRELAKDKEQYHRYKEWLVEQVNERIFKRFPHLKESLSILDVCTPHTFNRYVNSTNGVFMGFFFTARDGRFSHSGRLRGISNLYLSGQWLQGPGGLPLALTQGKFAIQRICKRENLSYVFSPIPKKKKA